MRYKNEQVVKSRTLLLTYSLCTESDFLHWNSSVLPHCSSYWGSCIWKVYRNTRKNELKTSYMQCTNSNTMKTLPWLTLCSGTFVGFLPQRRADCWSCSCWCTLWWHWACRGTWRETCSCCSPGSECWASPADPAEPGSNKDWMKENTLKYNCWGLSVTGTLVTL